MLVCNFFEVQMLLTLKSKLNTTWKKGKGDSSASSYAYLQKILRISFEHKTSLLSEEKCN